MQPHPLRSETSVVTTKSWKSYSKMFAPAKKNSSISSDYGADDDDDDDDDDSSGKDYLQFFEFYDDNSSVEEEDAIRRVISNEAYCFDTVIFAEKFVDAVIFEAKKAISQKLLTNYSCPLLRKLTSCSANQLFSFESFLRNSSYTSIEVVWPKISEFNIKLGQEKLEVYVSKWERSEEWQFCVEFLGFESEDCSNIFVYEVEWSKPTMSYPIPQVTASVFFAMEVFKMVPHNHDRIVEVSYVFECSNVIHRPGKIDFQEKWLQEIIDAKLKFFKSITFAVSNVPLVSLQDVSF